MRRFPYNPAAATNGDALDPARISYFTANDGIPDGDALSPAPTPPAAPVSPTTAPRETVVGQAGQPRARLDGSLPIDDADFQRIVGALPEYEADPEPSTLDFLGWPNPARMGVRQRNLQKRAAFEDRIKLYETYTRGGRKAPKLQTVNIVDPKTNKATTIMYDENDPNFQRVELGGVYEKGDTNMTRTDLFAEDPDAYTKMLNAEEQAKATAGGVGRRRQITTPEAMVQIYKAAGLTESDYIEDLRSQRGAGGLADLLKMAFEPDPDNIGGTRLNPEKFDELVGMVRRASQRTGKGGKGGGTAATLPTSEAEFRRQFLSKPERSKKYNGQVPADAIRRWREALKKQGKTPTR